MIPIAGPWVTDLEINYVKDAAQNGWYENYQDWNIRLEETFVSFQSQSIQFHYHIVLQEYI